MNRTITTLVLFAAAGVAGDASAKLRAVATLPDLAAIAQAVGGGEVEVTAIALPTQDPHFVDARPHLALELSRADLLLAVGFDLELGWLPVLQVGSRNAAIQKGARGFLDVSSFVRPLDVATQRVDRSMGDIHPSGNPHYLTDPRAALAVARGIAGKLSELDPEHAQVYSANLARFEQELAGLRAEAEVKLAGLRGAKVIAYHKTLSYLADWLGFEVAEHLEPKPGIPPNPGHVARVLSTARAQHVRAVLVESYYPATTARLVADKAGVPLIELAAGADVRAGERYIDRLRRLVAALAPIAAPPGDL